MDYEKLLNECGSCGDENTQDEQETSSEETVSGEASEEAGEEGSEEVNA